MSGIKPEYKVPSMREVEEIPWNGYNVVSTFSGGGGSCLGYRMAGYKVIWANEFVEEAQKTYRKNHKGVYLNTQDIKTVSVDDILQQCDMRPGQIDLFDGSPPCCAFSTAGKREKGWGETHSYSDGKQQFKIEELFLEYIRLLKGLQPKTFVAENVSGLVKGSAIGYFRQYIKMMRDCGYRVEAKLLNAKWLGVPTARERLIFVGVRNDLQKDPVFPKPFNYYYTIADAIKDVENDQEQVDKLLADGSKYKWGKVLKKMPKNPKRPITGASVMNGSYFNLRRESMYAPCGTICQRNGESTASGNVHPLYDRKFTIPELKRISGVPDDFECTGTFAQQWERIGRMVPPLMMKQVALTIKEKILDELGEY